MSMEISANAMDALQTRQQVTANNIANANTPGFAPGRVDMQEEGDRQGVRATPVQSGDTPDTTTARTETQPSRTDQAKEMVDMVATENAYGANATMLSAQAATQGKLINEMV
ncbi:flagellar basal body rod protein FlgB [Desulfoplanes sp.]